MEAAHVLPDQLYHTDADEGGQKEVLLYLYLFTPIIHEIPAETLNSHVGTSSPPLLASLSALSLSRSWLKTALRFFARRLTFLL